MFGKWKNIFHNSLKIPHGWKEVAIKLTPLTIVLTLDT